MAVLLDPHERVLLFAAVAQCRDEVCCCRELQNQAGWRPRTVNSFRTASSTNPVSLLKDTRLPVGHKDRFIVLTGKLE